MPEFKYQGSMHLIGGRDFFEVLQKMTHAYLECVAWSGGDGTKEDLAFDDFSIEAQCKAASDCADFLRHSDATTAISKKLWTPEQVGHDFWLTRNGHGAGFWDRYPAGSVGCHFGELMTKAAKGFGECYAALGEEDELIYLE